MPHAQRCSAADLTAAALQAALPAPEAPADARRSLLARSCPLPGAQIKNAGPPGGVGLDCGGAPAPLLISEQVAAEGGRGPRRALSGLPQAHAFAADKASSSPLAVPGGSNAGPAVKRAAPCEPPCDLARDRQEGLGPWLGSALAPAAPASPLALPDWQRLQMAVELLASMGASMPQSCEARARRPALLCIPPLCLTCTWPHACLQRSHLRDTKLGTAPVRLHIVMDLIVQSCLACLMHGRLRPSRVPWWR